LNLIFILVLICLSVFLACQTGSSVVINTVHQNGLWAVSPCSGLDRG